MRGEWRVGAGSVFCQGASLEGEGAGALVGCSAGGDGFVSRQVGDSRSFERKDSQRADGCLAEPFSGKLGFVIFLFLEGV